MITIALSAAAVRAASPGPIPRPVETTPGDGTFTIGTATRIHAEADFLPVAKQLVGMLAPAGVMAEPETIEPNLEFKATDAILLQRAAGADAEWLGPEGYTLSVTPTAIWIRAAEPAGAFYAMQTLRQLLPPSMAKRDVPGGPEPVTLDAVTIRDRPRFQWRGMHLDVCRHFFSADEVKSYIDMLAMNKYNRFHWHLTDDQGWRIPIDKYPLLIEVASKRAESPIPWNRLRGDKTPYEGRYTKEEIRDVVAYAAARHITIVPEIEMPGHSRAALAAYPELGCTGGPYEVGTSWGVEPDIFCAGNEKTFEFLEGVLDETMELFPSEFIHIGGDEARKTRWEECPKCQARIKEEGLANEDELQSWLTHRIERYLNSKGRRLIGWDEILEGGLAPNAAVMSWRGTKGGIAAASADHDVVMCPSSDCYFDHFQAKPEANEPPAIGGFTSLEEVYAFEPIPEELPADKAKYILGAQANLWTEYIPNIAKVQYMAYPRAMALAEVVWSPAEGRDYADFLRRLKPVLVRLTYMGINYRRPEELALPVDCEPDGS